jgi:hypothetical protein
MADYDKDLKTSSLKTAEPGCEFLGPLISNLGI